jgi:DinB superfamily
MATFGETTDGILRLYKFLRTMPSDTSTLSISTGQLDAVLKEAENVTLKAKDLVAGRSQADLAISLESDSWSVAQCLDHLARTTIAFVPALSSAIALAPRLTTNRALRTGAVTSLLIQKLEPPYWRRLKVLAPLIPHERDFNAAWGKFEESQAQLQKIIHSAAGLAIDYVKVESSVHARFSHNVYGALRMLTAHERRHLWQIENILGALDGYKPSTFPS